MQLLEEQGLPDLDELADEIVGRTERSMRAAIEKIPDGVYRAEGIVEQPEGRPDVTIKAAVEIKGSDVVVDLAGSSGHVGWGGNVVFNFTYAYVFMAIKSMLDPDMPNNDGCSRPIRLRAPEATVVNCKFPVAVAARMQIGHFLTEIVYRALAPALPDRVIAGSGGTPATMNVFYGKRADGKPWHSVIIRGGGMGAGSARDGDYVYIFPANGANTPVEIFESDTPLLVERRELLPDSGGPGRNRGGLGRREVLRVPDDGYAPQPPVNLGIQSGRFRYPPDALAEGRPGALAQFLVNGRSGNPYGLTQLQPGDVVVMDAAGGGGYGDPLTRNPEAVAADVADGVVLDPVSFRVDVAKTAELRRARLSLAGHASTMPPRQ